MASCLFWLWTVPALHVRQISSTLDEHRRPDHGDIEEQVNGEFACPGWLIQIVLTSPTSTAAP